VSNNAPQKLVVGVTGGIGSGKSTVTDKLAKLGIDIIDADIVARLVVLPGTDALTQISQHFGNTLILADGSLDRKALRAKVFADEKERLWLETLLHPIIRQEIQRQLDQSQSRYSVLSSPLLLETGQHSLVDKVLLVDTTEALQISRTQKRDDTSVEAVSAIMAAQWPRTKRQAHADFIILNDGDLEQLESDVMDIHHTFLALTSNR